MVKQSVAASAVLACCMAVAWPAASTGSSGGCGDTVHYGGETYITLVKLSRPVKPGRLIKTTFGPYCANAGERDTVRAITGISPRVALLRRGVRRKAWLASGYLPQLRGHPLHSRLYRKGGPKPACRKGRVVSWKYPIGPTPSGRRPSVLFLKNARSDLIGAEPYEGTKLTSKVKARGVPHIEGQYLASSTVRRCASGRNVLLRLSVRPRPTILDLPD